MSGNWLEDCWLLWIVSSSLTIQILCLLKLVTKSITGKCWIVLKLSKQFWYSNSCNQHFFHWQSFAKSEIKKIKSKMRCFVRFSIARVREKNSKYHQIPIFGFQCVAKCIERWLKIQVSYLIDSHIWLNLSRDHRLFFSIFLEKDGCFSYILVRLRLLKTSNSIWF